MDVIVLHTCIYWLFTYALLYVAYEHEMADKQVIRKLSVENARLTSALEHRTCSHPRMVAGVQPGSAEEILDTGPDVRDAPQTDDLCTPVRVRSEPHSSASGVTTDSPADTDCDTVEPDLDCTVCWNPVDSSSPTFFKTPCGHIFHLYCISKWVAQHRSCPICRSTLLDVFTPLANTVHRILGRTPRLSTLYYRVERVPHPSLQNPSSSQPECSTIWETESSLRVASLGTPTYGHLLDAMI
jgi:hypothetical protein